MSKSKSLVQMFEEAVRQPVPYEGLSSDPVVTGFAVEPSLPETRPESDSNPNHREDFMRLVGAASKRKPAGDRT